MLWPDGSSAEPRLSGDNRDGEADFGPRKTGKGWHDGVDYGNYFRFIRAIDAGTVTRVQNWNGKSSMQHGNRVWIDHGGGVESSYSHLAWVDVKPGQRVEAGQALGTMGATGFVTGVHLHLEIRVNGTLVDPRSFIRGRIGGAPASTVEAPFNPPKRKPKGSIVEQFYRRASTGEIGLFAVGVTIFSENEYRRVTVVRTLARKVNPEIPVVIPPPLAAANFVSLGDRDWDLMVRLHGGITS